MKYSLLILMLISLIFFVQCSHQTEPEKDRILESKKDYDIGDQISRILINERESGYNQFNTTIITNSDSLSSFIDIQSQNYWYDKDTFFQGISDSTLNMNEVNLILFRHSETSGGTMLKVDRPFISNDLITIKINRPVLGVTDDMARYCFAYSIKKDIDEIEFDIENIGRIRISVH